VEEIFMYVYPQVRTATVASAVEARKVTAAGSPGPLQKNQHQEHATTLVEGLIRTLNLILETLNTIYPDAYQAIREVVKKDALIHHRHQQQQQERSHEYA